MNKIKYIIAFLVVAIAGLFFYYRSGTATLEWSPNTEPDLAGYKIYYGSAPRTGDCPPGGYPNSVDLGNNSKHQFKNLKRGQSYYFSVTSYDKNKNESCFSVEAKKDIALPKILSFIKIIN